MNRQRIKKIAYLIVKIAILAGLLEYARLRGVDLRESAGVSPPVYRATAPDGRAVEILARDVEGSPAHDASVHARFSLLPGLRTLVRQLDLRLLAFAFLSFGPPLFLMG